MDDPTKDTVPRSAVEYCLRNETVNTNPEKYKTHKKFIGYMNDPDISEFGHWMHSNGFNCALTTISVDLKKIPSAQPEIIRCKDCKHRPTPTRADEGITLGFSVEFPDEKCPCQCEDGWYNWYPGDDFFCGYAERREK